MQVIKDNAVEETFAELLNRRFSRWLEGPMFDDGVKQTMNHLEKLGKKMPPAVRFALINICLNGWNTARRFQETDIGECKLCVECDGRDCFEHHANCKYQKQFLEEAFGIQLQNGMQGILLQQDFDDDELVVVASHIYAMRQAINQANSLGRRLNRNELWSILASGLRTVAVYGNNVVSSYNSVKSRMRLPRHLRPISN